MPSNTLWNAPLRWSRCFKEIPLVPINSSICIHTGFPDVARSQNHNLHSLVGHTVHQGILRNGDQQKVARPAAAAVHGSWRRVASQLHLAWLANAPEQKKKTFKSWFQQSQSCSCEESELKPPSPSRFLLLTLILVVCVQSSKSPNIPPISSPG